MTSTATHGTVREVKDVNGLRPGMKLERDVMGRGDKVLARAGEVLTQKHVQQFDKWEKREQPRGPALAKKNIKDVRERVRHAPFEGGYKLSHFNPRGFTVSTTIASGDEVPAVEKDPTKSPLFQNKPTTSFSVPIDVVESPLVRVMELKAEIKGLMKVNSKLGGSIVSDDSKLLIEEDYIKFRDEIEADNDRLIETKNAPAPTGKRGRPRSS